jgi:hypothetical protein
MVSAFRRSRFVLSVLLLTSAQLAACQSLDLGEVTRVLISGGALDESTVASGLREALEIGTTRASGQLSAPGGFGDDPALRLRIPEEAAPMVKTLRAIGLGSKVDEVEDAMNRAAEAAAAEAVPVFAGAIQAMTIQDAFGILRGPDDAATRYFREKTSTPLRERFSPVVRESIEKVGLYRMYKDIKRRYDAIPLVKPVAPELEDYVTDRTLDGLFQVLATEEAKIREDPAARTTALLRKVFAG